MPHAGQSVFGIAILYHANCAHAFYARTRRKFNPAWCTEAAAKVLSCNIAIERARCVSPISVRAPPPVICINPDTHEITTMMLKIINTVTLFPRQRNWRHPVKYVITNDIRRGAIKREHAEPNGKARQWRRATAAVAAMAVDNIRSRRVDTLSGRVIGSTMPGRASPIARVTLIRRAKSAKETRGID